MSIPSGRRTQRYNPPAGRTQPAPSIGASVRESLAKLTRVLDGLDAVLGDEENQANLQKSLAGLAKATQQAGEAMASLKSLAADVSKTSGEARLTIVEARRAVAQIGKTAERFSGSADTLDRQVERVATRLIEGADKLAGLLATLNRTVTKVEAGEGTAGKLLNDPKLYNNLLEAIDQLTKLMGQLRRTVEHWQANGIPLKMAK